MLLLNLAIVALAIVAYAVAYDFSQHSCIPLPYPAARTEKVFSVLFHPYFQVLGVAPAVLLLS